MTDTMQTFKDIRIGYAMCGSFCTFSKSIKQLERLKELGADVTPIMSFNAASTDTRFGTAEDFRNTVTGLTGHELICTIDGAEPIGPRKMFDVLVICPCTGNTLAKLALGVIDTAILVKRKR